MLQPTFVLISPLYFLGGFQVLPVKHGEAKKLNYKSGFYITCNQIPDFVDPADQAAILTRLEVFQTKSLPNKDPSVNRKYLFKPTLNVI